MSMLGCFLAVTPRQLGTVQSDPKALRALLDSEPEPSGDDGFDVDTAWNAIHFLLTGVRCGERAEGCPPLFGDREIPGSEYGYGAVFSLTAAQVKAALAWMRAHPPESLRCGYDAAALARAKVYPDIWRAADGVALDFVLERYAALIAFYERATSAGSALLFYLA
ncbi:MAG: YfbM family protein [Methylocystis sp.]